MSGPQAHTFRQILCGLTRVARTCEDPIEPMLFRHGDCVGSDAESHDIVVPIGYSIIIHPPSNPKLRAYKTGALFVMPPKDYHARNRDIVDPSERMIFTPDTPEYRIKSGTWYTWKYARERGIDTLVIRPDGSTQLEFGKTPQQW